MQLTNEQKEALSGIMKHPWFKVLNECIKDFENNVLQSLKTINLANENDLAILNAKQNYLKWLEDFTKTLSGKTNQIGKRKFD